MTLVYRKLCFPFSRNIEWDFKDFDLRNVNPFDFGRLKRHRLILGLIGTGWQQRQYDDYEQKLGE